MQLRVQDLQKKKGGSGSIF